MKRTFLFLCACLCVIGMATACGSGDGWKLVWVEEFDGDDGLDTAVWSKIPRGKSDWNNYMSDYDSLFAVRDGNLILRGIVNDVQPEDTAGFLTGGVYTKGKKAFDGGRIEIRAKFQGAKGEWPAFWMLPVDGSIWPTGGEIDIMERLNYDDYAYQTVHSHYTHDLGFENEPPHSGTNSIDPDDYNVYSVDIHRDSLVFAINHKHTLTYPRISTDKEGQFPFCRPFYLMLDMQLGGSWVGEVDPATLPVEMYIDWVKYYSKN
ncbi:MAG: glycoside hydrolase family 16 protein [Bacteroidales bacterium]|nr:glycoside hydrolase family 16 protein [Bacteroidales bacterium]